jgi:predicted nucleic acid-binding protein
MKRIFLDANILLEILFDRRLATECKSIVSNPSNEYAISVITVHIVWYMAEKYNLQAQLIDDLLSVWVILPLTDQIIQVSRSRYDGKDFEDCLQASCAEAGSYDEIVTIDKHFKAHSHTELPVTVLKP